MAGDCPSEVCDQTATCEVYPGGYEHFQPGRIDQSMTPPAFEDGASWHPLFHKGDAAHTVLLLHGTGGNEHSLLGVGRALAPQANFLSVRGRSLEEGFPRFFRRFSMLEYDQDHLEQEADALAEFVSKATAHYALDAGKVVALGYSNGANIGFASCARNPTIYRGLVLIRPVMPFEEAHRPMSDLSGIPVLLLIGANDPYRDAQNELAGYLRARGAVVQEEITDAGHQVVPSDLAVAAQWLEDNGFLV